MRSTTDLILDLCLATGARLYPIGRALGRKVGLSLSRFPRLAALAQAIQDPYAKVETFDLKYADCVDHWGYTTNPTEIARHQLAMELLEGARSEKRFGRVVEIGCAEGVFTAMLAPLCESLLAVDFSQIALERARRKCTAHPGVDFKLWDLRRDSFPWSFDLVVVMDVLCCIRRPIHLRGVYRKLVDSLRSGGLLFVCDDKHILSLDDSWLGRRLLLGGKWAIQGLIQSPSLETLKRVETETHAFALLRKL